MTPRQIVERLRASLTARAAGLWKVDGDLLELVAFDSAPDMPAPVAAGFAEATRSVAISRPDLAICVATTSAEPTITRDDGDDGRVGSRSWLVAFGARRSIVVPILGPEGVRVVLSVALAGDEPPDEAVVEALRKQGNWF